MKLISAIALLIFTVSSPRILVAASNSPPEAGTPRSDGQQVRVYPIKTDSFIENLKHSITPKSGESNQDLLLRFLKEKDCEVKSPGKVVLDEKNNRLVAKASKVDQDKLLAILEKFLFNPKP